MNKHIGGALGAALATAIFVSSRNFYLTGGQINPLLHAAGGAVFGVAAFAVMYFSDFKAPILAPALSFGVISAVLPLALYWLHVSTKTDPGYYIGSVFAAVLFSTVAGIGYHIGAFAQRKLQRAATNPSQ